MVADDSAAAFLVILTGLMILVAFFAGSNDDFKR